MTNTAPRRADAADLVVESLGEETLVFDRRSDTAHCLNPVASLVWASCDGERTVGDLAALVAGIGEEDADQLVERALGDLRERRLILADGVSRRSAISRMAGIGASAISVPMVVSILAPTAAWAGSITTGNVCTSSGSAVGGCASPDDICTNGTGGTTTRYCVPKAFAQTCRGSTASSPSCLVAGANTACCSGACSGLGVCA